MHYSMTCACANIDRYQKAFFFSCQPLFQLVSKVLINYQCLESCKFMNMHNEKTNCYFSGILKEFYHQHIFTTSLVIF